MYLGQLGRTQTLCPAGCARAAPTRLGSLKQAQGSPTSFRVRHPRGVSPCLLSVIAVGAAVAGVEAVAGCVAEGVCVAGAVAAGAGVAVDCGAGVGGAAAGVAAGCLAADFGAGCVAAGCFASDVAAGGAAAGCDAVAAACFSVCAIDSGETTVSARTVIPARANPILISFLRSNIGRGWPRSQLDPMRVSAPQKAS
jgi:hypothetical protein